MLEHLGGSVIRVTAHSQGMHCRRKLFMLFLHLPSGMTLQAGKCRNNMRAFHHVWLVRGSRGNRSPEPQSGNVIILTLTFQCAQTVSVLALLISQWKSMMFREMQQECVLTVRLQPGAARSPGKRPSRSLQKRGWQISTDSPSFNDISCHLRAWSI